MRNITEETPISLGCIIYTVADLRLINTPASYHTLCFVHAPILHSITLNLLGLCVEGHSGTSVYS